MGPDALLTLSKVLILGALVHSNIGQRGFTSFLLVDLPAVSLLICMVVVVGLAAPAPGVALLLRVLHQIEN